MAASDRLIVQYSITATTANWRRLGVSRPWPSPAELADHPFWRVEERVIGCNPAVACARDEQAAARSVCEHVIARDLTLAQAAAHLRGLLINQVVTCEE